MATFNPPGSVSHGSSRLAGRHRERVYSPVSWMEYFDEAHDIDIATGGWINNNEDGEIPTNSSINDGNNKSNISVHQTEEASDSFRVYLRNFHEPYAPKREFGQRLNPIQIEVSQEEMANYSKVPTLVTLHGGGYSGLTWAQFTRHIEQHCQCRVLAIDLRSHGDTKTTCDEQMDIDTLVSDVINVTHATHQICGFQQTPKLVLIGHSMGGAIAVKCATKCSESLPSLAGFVIIDVVEGTAKDALPLMMSVIKTRPTKFPSLSNAIEWSVRSGMAKNSDAARVSMPGNLVNIAAAHLSIHDVPPPPSRRNHSEAEEKASRRSSYLAKIRKHKFSISLEQLIGPGPPAALLPKAGPLPPRLAALRSSSMPPLAAMPVLSAPPVAIEQITNRTTISEEQEANHGDESNQPNIDSSQITNLEESSESSPEKRVRENVTDNGGYKRPPEVDTSGYGWRTNLARTQPYWNGWFDGLSAQLLDAPVQGKFLLLAGIDRLDKALTIGHMQGKFMMKVLPKCGHAVHEDVPEQVASAIGDFLVRNKFAVSCATNDDEDNNNNNDDPLQH